MNPQPQRPLGGGAAGLELDDVASYPRFVQEKGESYTDNSKRESAEGVSLAAEFLRKSTEDAVNEAMEDSFEPFPEDCVEGAVSPRNGHCERSVLTNAGSVTVRVPRDRLNLFGERILGRCRRRIDDFDAEAERYNRSERNRRISGFFDLTPGKLEMLGMERRECAIKYSLGRSRHRLRTPNSSVVSRNLHRRT